MCVNLTPREYPRMEARLFYLSFPIKYAIEGTAAFDAIRKSRFRDA